MPSPASYLPLELKLQSELNQARVVDRGGHNVPKPLAVVFMLPSGLVVG